MWKKLRRTLIVTHAAEIKPKTVPLQAELRSHLNLDLDLMIFE